MWNGRSGDNALSDFFELASKHVRQIFHPGYYDFPERMGKIHPGDVADRIDDLLERTS